MPYQVSSCYRFTQNCSSRIYPMCGPIE